MTDGVMSVCLRSGCDQITAVMLLRNADRGGLDGKRLVFVSLENGKIRLRRRCRGVVEASRKPQERC